MNDSSRPKYIFDHIEAIAAEHGHFEPVDENYYQTLVELNQPQIEELAIALMLDQEKEVRRLAGGKTESNAADRVSKFVWNVRNMFTGISLGFARFDAFGNFGFVARIGFEPMAEMDEITAEKLKLVEPLVTNIEGRTLSWLLSREISETSLPS